jgi:metal-responsive CopG/Arc/MetJ family transcriptional regulator
VLSEKENKKAKCISADLEKGLLEKIDYLVNDAKQFKSRDDFIALARHEFMVRRNPAAALMG